MEAFARDLGDDGPPFRWDEERRTLIRAELDAAYFHLYGLERDEVEHVMDSFDALRRREEKPQNFGEFRTKRLILERYDAMAEAIRTGEPYQTILDPPPGQGPRHPARDVVSEGAAVADGQVRRALLVRAILEILRDAAAPMQPRAGAADDWRAQSSSTPHELSCSQSGSSRWETALRFHTRRCRNGRLDDQAWRLGDHRGRHRGAGDVPDAR